MRFGICTSTDNADQAAAAGFEFIEITVSELMRPEAGHAFTSWAERVRTAPAPVEVANCLIPGHLKVTGPDVDTAALRLYLEQIMPRAAAAGVTVVVFGSGSARRLPDGFPPARGWEQLADAARLAAEIGDDHGVTVAMEPLFTRACNFFNRVDQGAALVDRVGHPRLQLLADLFHMAAENEPFDSVTAAAARLAHIHVATPALPETGEGPVYDFAHFFAALRAAGYDGRVAVEDNPGLLTAHPAPLTPVYRAILTFLRREAGDTLNGIPLPASCM